MTTENTEQNTPPSAPEVAPPGAAVQRRLVLAWLALSWERLWSRLWVVGVLFGVFAIVLLTDVLPSLHWVAHMLAILAAAAGTGYLAWRRLRGFAWPTRDEARARLETTSPVMHRPLTTVEDTLVSGANAIQEWMWRLHQARAREDLDRLRVKGPSPGVAARDRFALRAAVVLALFVAVIGGWSDMSNRMWRGVLPMLGGDASNISVKLWITPPAYTNLSPIYVETPLPAGTKPLTTIDIPVGSKALTIVTGTGRDTVLKLDDTTTPLEKLADESERLEMDLKPAKRLEVRQAGRMLAGWDIKTVYDAYPTVAMTQEPSEATRWHFRIDYLVRDDYGVDSVKAVITREDEPGSLEFPLNMPAGAGNIFTHFSVHDLTSSLWAGERVVVQLVAVDHAGNSSKSEEIEARLPLRTFNNPVAKELVKWRKGIATTPDETIPPALESVTRILQHPEGFGGEPLVHLTLATAKYRMANEPHADASQSVPDLLWHAAVRIEDGNLVNAEQRLAAAEKALREAVERGATPEEIKQKLAELKDAISEYGKALAEKNPDSKSATSKSDKKNSDAALDEAMDDVSKMSEMGAADAAKQALANLQEQLDAMREGSKKQDPNDPEVKKAQELMNQMNEAAEEQANLMNDSFDKSKDGKTNADKKDAGKAAAEKQEAVKKKLDDVKDKLEEMTGESPDAMDDASQNMADAIDQLSQGQWKDAAGSQSKAADKLQQGISEAEDKLLQALMDKGLGGMIDKSPGMAKYSQLGTRDERRGGEKVNLPTGPDSAGMAQRVRVILDEIRKRSSDLTRPESEQDYLRRLKKQF